MAEVLKVWCLNGYDDEGDWDIELFSTYEKARKAFEDYIDELAVMYGEYDRRGMKYKSVCTVADDVADYDCDNHYGHFWISEKEVR